MLEPQTLKVATFNVQHGSRGNYEDPGDPELTAEFCKSLDVDFLGIQEADRGVPRSKKVHMAKYIAKICDMDYYFAPTRTYRGRGKVGNALLVRGEIKNPKEFRFGGDWQYVTIGSRRIPLVPEPRKAIIADVTSGGYELIGGVIHAGGKTRLDMISTAATLARLRGAPCVLLGDFNAGLQPSGDSMSRLGFEVIRGTYPSGVEPAKQPQIDHIAVYGLRCVSQSFIPVSVSDHDPFVAALLVA